MRNRFIEWSNKNYSEKQRLITIIPLGLLFPILIPAIIVKTSDLDEILNFPKFELGLIGIIAGIILIASGFSLAIWTIFIQFNIGKGTPVPMMPTQRLIITGPYKYCRNPMVLGTILAYFGIVVLTGSLSSFILFLIMISTLLLYVKRIEEKELEERFGQDYLEYKKKVPFIIPIKPL
ncbi:MAG: isoprenylcysteine carboxylmethyltransferase family protein [Eubacteriales bacterium]